jgi:hypothetical protein
VDAGSVRRVSATTNDVAADGEVVWFWRSDAGAKLAMMLRITASDGGNQAMVTGEQLYSSKAPYFFEVDR